MFFYSQQKEKQFKEVPQPSIFDLPKSDGCKKPPQNLSVNKSSYQSLVLDHLSQSDWWVGCNFCFQRSTNQTQLENKRSVSSFTDFPNLVLTCSYQSFISLFLPPFFSVVGLRFSRMYFNPIFHLIHQD